MSFDHPIGQTRNATGGQRHALDAGAAEGAIQFAAFAERGGQVEPLPGTGEDGVVAGWRHQWAHQDPGATTR